MNEIGIKGLTHTTHRVNSEDIILDLHYESIPLLLDHSETLYDIDYGWPNAGWVWNEEFNTEVLHFGKSSKGQISPNRFGSFNIQVAISGTTVEGYKGWIRSGSSIKLTLNKLVNSTNLTKETSVWVAPSSELSTNMDVTGQIRMSIFTVFNISDFYSTDFWLSIYIESDDVFESLPYIQKGNAVFDFKSLDYSWPDVVKQEEETV